MKRTSTFDLNHMARMAVATMALAMLAAMPAPAYAGDGLSSEERAIIRGFYNWAEGDSSQQQHSGPRHDYDHQDKAGKKAHKNAHKNAHKGSKQTPPGLAKKGGMAPGHRKQLERGKGLPPGIAKRDLPANLETSLPHRADAYYRIIDNDVVLIERGTELVLDILTDVVRGN